MNKEQIAIYEKLDLDLLKLKGIPYEELKILGENPLEEILEVLGRTFIFSSWSEPAVNEKEETIAVFVDTWRTKLFFISYRYIKGFLIEPSGQIRDLSETELWEYD